MLIGYARISKADGPQSLDLQHDAFAAAGVARDRIYDDRASGARAMCWWSGNLTVWAAR